jgi:hypothetical protein
MGRYHKSLTDVVGHRSHRDTKLTYREQNALPERCIIEIGLERAHFFVLVYFFPYLNMQEPAVYGPNSTKDSSLKCDFLIFNYIFCQNLVFIVKNQI